jgi:hypothetical protein
MQLRTDRGLSVGYSPAPTSVCDVLGTTQTELIPLCNASTGTAGGSPTP